MKGDLLLGVPNIYFRKVRFLARESASVCEHAKSEKKLGNKTQKRNKEFLNRISDECKNSHPLQTGETLPGVSDFQTIVVRRAFGLRSWETG